MKIVNKISNSNIIISILLLIICSILILNGETYANAAEPIEFNILSAWAPNYGYVRVFLIPLVERLNQKAEGKLKVTWVGPEAVPTFEQFKPLKEGLFDALFTHPDYHSGDIMIGNAISIMKGTAEERRSAGMVALLDEAYEKYNVSFKGLMIGGGYQIILKKPVEKADFKGLRIRTTPFYDPLIKALGGNGVVVAGNELYTALEAGIVDGACWPAVGAYEFRWHEVAKYYLRPTFAEAVNVIMVNNDKWNSLPDDLKSLIDEVIKEIEVEGAAQMKNEAEIEKDLLIKEGVTFIQLPPEEGEKFLKTFEDETWEKVIFKYEPVFGPRAKKISDDLTLLKQKQ